MCANHRSTRTATWLAFSRFHWGALLAISIDCPVARKSISVCATGNRSYAAANLLTAAGFDVVSVRGSTRAWVEGGGRLVSGAPEAVTIVAIDTPSLGDRSYLVHDGTVAFVVDPQRDIDRILSLLEDKGLQLTEVFETHIHNDYVTGGLALSRATGAQPCPRR